MIARLLLLALLLLLPIQIGNANFQHIHIIQFDEYHMISKYDDLIKVATKEHLPPDYDWRLLKAQLWQESKLDPAATSPAGAKGIAQFMDATWAEWSLKAGYSGADVRDPAISIDVAAAYMAKLIEGWKWERQTMDRYCLALASYNAGFGSMLNAQKQRGGAVEYAEIIKGLPKVTGLNSLETINYVREVLNYCTGQITGEFEND